MKPKPPTIKPSEWLEFLDETNNSNLLVFFFTNLLGGIPVEHEDKVIVDGFYIFRSYSNSP